MQMRELKKLTGAIAGALFPAEGILLYCLAQKVKGSSAIVEIGDGQGRATLWLAHGSLAGAQAPVYSIGPLARSPEPAAGGSVDLPEAFLSGGQRAGVAHLIRVLPMTSAEAARELGRPVDLIFIDGARDYESVRQDFESWYPKVRVGGVMAFHEALGGPGSKRLVTEKLFCSASFETHWKLGITYGYKQAYQVFWREQNHLRLWLKNAFAPLFLVAVKASEVIKRKNPLNLGAAQSAQPPLKALECGSVKA